MTQNRGNMEYVYECLAVLLYFLAGNYLFRESDNINNANKH